MTTQSNPADVAVVTPEQLDRVMKKLIADGRGLALFHGMTDAAIRELEDAIWLMFENEPTARHAIALRFRALFDVFATRRLKGLLAHLGFKALARATSEAATQRLNVRFGFNAQKFVAALASPAAPQTVTIADGFARAA